MVVVVLGLAALAAAGSAVLRVVPAGHVGVVRRAGRAQRVVPPGPVGVVPGLDRVDLVALHPRPLDPVATTATTADGVEVYVVVSVVWQVVDPRLTIGAVPDPATVVAEWVERGLHHLTAGAQFADLLRERHAAVRRLPETLGAALAPFGIRVLDIDLLDIDVRVGAELLRLLA
jgi:regulator of protease activity HflC (stomatin/prohibitin superfamily)